MVARGHGGVIKISKSIEANNTEKKLGGACPQSGFSRNRSPKKNVSSLAHYTKAIHICVFDRILEIGLVVPSQIIFVPRTE